METNTDASNAVPNEETENPSINCAVSKKSEALITSKNRPKVRMVTGRVNSTKIGLTKTFRIPRTKDANNAEYTLVISIPGSNCATSRSETAVMTILIALFISDIIQHST